MAVIEKFLGQCVEIPEDRRYFIKQGLWAKREDQAVVFGLTQPALVLSGGFKDVDWLVENGQMVNAGEAVVFAITGKILYIDTPIAGTVRFNTAIRENPGQAATDPYNEGWLYQMQPEGDLDGAYQSLSSAEEYFASLQGSDGLKNPEGIKGGVSGICKAVYTGINVQKI